jgi:GNAT superfamily N-acetyltransferase
MVQLGFRGESELPSRCKKPEIVAALNDQEDQATGKRIYVRPGQRGKRIGESILQQILDDAKAFGYQSMWLDSAPFMQSAQRIYQRYGFVDREPYPEVEAPKELHPIIRFMERSL